MTSIPLKVYGTSESPLITDVTHVSTGLSWKVLRGKEVISRGEKGKTSSEKGPSIA